MLILKNFSISVLALIVLISMYGCADKKTAVYSPDEAGTVMQTRPGILLSYRNVVISGLQRDKEYWGSIIGGIVAGAATYGLTEGDTPLGEAAIIIAVVGGAIAGTALEELRNTSDGVEYTIKTDDGETVVIVQAISNESDIIPENTSINIIYSVDGYVRVTPTK